MSATNLSGTLCASATRRVVLAAAIVSLLIPSAAKADYPERPITVVVPFAAGGPTDLIARLMAEPMSRMLGQQVIIENAVGAGGTVGATRVARSQPDGYVLLMGNLGSQVATVGLYPKLAYDPQSDFEPIINTGGTPMIVAAKERFAGQGFSRVRRLLETECRQK